MDQSKRNVSLSRGSGGYGFVLVRVHLLRSLAFSPLFLPHTHTHTLFHYKHTHTHTHTFPIIHTHTHTHTLASLFTNLLTCRVDIALHGFARLKPTRPPSSSVWCPAILSLRFVCVYMCLLLYSYVHIALVIARLVSCRRRCCCCCCSFCCC